jgi:hypothetical protein
MKIRRFGYLRAILALIAIVAIAAVMGAAPVPTVTTQPTPTQATIIVAPAHYRRRETDPAVNLTDIKDAVGPPPDYGRTNVSVSIVDAENTEDVLVSMRTYVTTHITCKAGCDDARSSYTFAGLSGPPDNDQLVLRFTDPRTAYLTDGAFAAPGHPTMSFACSSCQIEGNEGTTARFHHGHGPPTFEPGFGAQVAVTEQVDGTFARRH